MNSDEIKENAVPKVGEGTPTPEQLGEVKEKLDDAPVPESAVPLTEMPASGVPTPEEVQARLEESHKEMWEALDGKSPFEWPEQARNLYTSGCQCSLWGRSVVDMTPEQMILFVAYIDTIASDMRSQLNGAFQMINEISEKAKKEAAAAEG